MIQQFAENKADFAVCQAIEEMLVYNFRFRVGNTHFFPRQFRGPRLNGCKTSLLSSAKRGSCRSHRSGRKACGKAKLDEEWYEA